MIHPTQKEMEQFLEAQCPHYHTEPFYHGSQQWEKIVWLKTHADLAKRIMLKMRGVGRKRWDAFLDHFELEEHVSLKDTNQ